MTNVSNGKSVVVRVTDRGPFHADRVIDLSYLAAYRLGYVDNGSTLVNVESILPEGATTMTYAQVMPVARPQRPVGGPVEHDEIELLAAKLSLDKPPVSSMATGGPSPALSSAAASASSASMRSVFLQLIRLSAIPKGEDRQQCGIHPAERPSGNLLALSWSRARQLALFARSSPFVGLRRPFVWLDGPPAGGQQREESVLA